MASPHEVPTDITPVFIQQSDLETLSQDAKNRHVFYVDEMEPVLEARRASGEDAILQGAALLMTKSVVALVHVDITKQRQSDRPNEDHMKYKNKKQPIGFNDHGGGFEKRFKILLNGSPDEPHMQYVLYSPPDNVGNPANTTFHRADFNFVGSSPKGPFTGPGHVPGSVKTADAHKYQADLNYQYYIFGGPDVPKLVYEKFAAAGFDFVTTPYSTQTNGFQDTMTRSMLRKHEGTAIQKLGVRGYHFWPGDQFEAQLQALGLEAPKLSPKDYPLVRPRNKLG